MHPLIYLLIVILIVGVLIWVINNFLPMDEKIKKLFNVIAVVALVIYIIVVLIRYLPS